MRSRVALALLTVSSVSGLVADPLFQQIGAAEAFFAASLAMPVLATLIYRGPVDAGRDRKVLLLMASYLGVMFLSSLLGAFGGSDAVAIFRSLGPLVLPLLVWAIVFQSAPVAVLRLGFLSFVIAGACQAFYIYFLYATNVAMAPVSTEVVARVTYFDLRPLQPYLLAALAFGAAYLFRAASSVHLVLGACMFGVAFLGVLFTQTRTFILISGALLVISPVLVLLSPAVGGGTKRSAAQRIGLVAAVGVAAAAVALASGHGSELLDSIFDRFGGALDRDDWFIAMESMQLDSVLGILFGIGVGSTFDYYGQQVSFVHDGFIYHLIFAGVGGLLIYSALLVYIGYRLTRGFLLTGSTLMLGIALTYIAMVTYTLTFAVYKWPTFNVMIGFFAVVAAAQQLGQTPKAVSRQIKRGETPHGVRR